MGFNSAFKGLIYCPTILMKFGTQDEHKCKLRTIFCVFQ